MRGKVENLFINYMSILDRLREIFIIFIQLLCSEVRLIQYNDNNILIKFFDISTVLICYSIVFVFNFIFIFAVIIYNNLVSVIL